MPSAFVSIIFSIEYFNKSLKLIAIYTPLDDPFAGISTVYSCTSRTSCFPIETSCGKRSQLKNAFCSSTNHNYLLLSSLIRSSIGSTYTDKDEGLFHRHCSSVDRLYRHCKLFPRTAVRQIALKYGLTTNNFFLPRPHDSRRLNLVSLEVRMQILIVTPILFPCKGSPSRSHIPVEGLSLPRIWCFLVRFGFSFC
jgi:hypothetical protein